MARAKHVPITSSILSWAIESSGLAPEELAAKVDIDLTTLETWLSGEQKPKLTQFKRLAQALKRPMAFFLLPEPPSAVLPDVRFRHPIDSARVRPNPNELRFLREAARFQRALSWIRRELDEQPVPLARVSTDTDVEEPAAGLRQVLGVTVPQQLEWESPGEALQGWRNALETLGIYVFFFPMGATSSRGFSLWEDYAPVVAANTHWNYEARMFTIFHEIGHLLTRSDSVCLNPARQLTTTGGDALERWCERFAASVLLPWPQVSGFLRDQLGWMGGQITNLDEVRFLARKFRVSLRAAALRLIQKGISTWDMYEQIPAWTEDKGGGGGRGRTRRQMREDWYGDRAARTLLEALEQELMTSRDVLGYLNVTASDLEDMQAER